MRQQKRKGDKLMKVNKLKAKVVERGMTIEKLANKLGIHQATLYRKLNASDNITIGEAVKMKKILDIKNEEAVDIFLS